MEWCPPLHLGVVAIEKGAFGSPSTMFANFTYFLVLSRYNWNYTTMFKLFVLDKNTYNHVTMSKKVLENNFA